MIFLKKPKTGILQLLLIKLCIFFLETKINERILNEENIYNEFDCYIIFLLLLNPAVSKETMTFLNDLDLYKIPQKIKILGAIYLFRYYYLFNVIQISQKSLSNLLDFLEIDFLSKNYLINKTLKEKTFQSLESFFVCL